MDRDEFRRAVFARDGYKCIVCGTDTQDAHHILERRLFDSDGYVPDNGVSLCARCHVLAEQTLLSPSQLREAAGISTCVLPDHLYPDHDYDKWGNIVLPSGIRLKGELFHDESVQRILPREIKDLFLPYVKYPRTYHAPWTASLTSDDRIYTDANMDRHFTGREVVVTEKRDGENSSVYWDGYFHARSVDGHGHPSQSWLKNFAQNWCYELPKEWRVCGENLYATHSIPYNNLVSYFEVFGIWSERNCCIPWDDTKTWCELLGLETVPELWRGTYDRQALIGLANDLDTEHSEGYVIRAAGAYLYAEHRYRTAKFVRAAHVQTTAHNWHSRWTSEKVNRLRPATQDTPNSRGIHKS